MSGELKGRKIAILATDGFEQVELTDPKKYVEAAGASTEVLSVKDGSIKGWKFTDWGDSVRVDRLVGKANVDDYDALILPGGQINPDKLRMEKPAVEFVKKFVATGKPVAAICHGPWMLIEAGVVKGKNCYVMALDPHRPGKRRREMGGQGSGGGREPDHQPEARRYSGVQQEADGSCSEDPAARARLRTISSISPQTDRGGSSLTSARRHGSDKLPKFRRKNAPTR